MSPDELITNQAMDQARGDGGLIVTSAVVLLEVMHEDGDSYLHIIRSDGLPVWTAAGMCNYARSQWEAAPSA